MLKRLFVLRVDDYWPELCKFTIPTIKHWATKNGWTYSEILERRYPAYPATLEKTRVWSLGKDADWNLLCDADVMLRPDFLDPTSFVNPNCVASSYHFKSSDKFADNGYRRRDGRYIGMSGGFVLSSRITHQVWSPPENLQLALKETSKNPHLIDEQILSNNLARYGLPYDGVSPDPDAYIVHFGGTNDRKTYSEKQDAVVRAGELWLDWTTVWPSLEALKFARDLSKS